MQDVLAPSDWQKLLQAWLEQAVSTCSWMSTCCEKVFQRNPPVLEGCRTPRTTPAAGVRLLALLEAHLTQQELLETALTHQTPSWSDWTETESSESTLMLRLSFQGERQWPVEKSHCLRLPEGQFVQMHMQSWLPGLLQDLLQLQHSTLSLACVMEKCTRRRSPPSQNLPLQCNRQQMNMNCSHNTQMSALSPACDPVISWIASEVYCSCLLMLGLKVGNGSSGGLMLKYTGEHSRKQKLTMVG